MKSTLFASTLAAALTATSFGQVEVELISECCNATWNHTYENQLLHFDTTAEWGGTAWEITVPSSTIVTFSLSQLCGLIPPSIEDMENGSNTPFYNIYSSWNAQGGASMWSGSFALPAGNYVILFNEFRGTMNFNSAAEAQGSCCVSSGCTSNSESSCTELGGTWTQGGSCDDCEPAADDCPADVDGDGSIGFSDVLIILNDWGACP